MSDAPKAMTVAPTPVWMRDLARRCLVRRGCGDLVAMLGLDD